MGWDAISGYLFLMKAGALLIQFKDKHIFKYTSISFNTCYMPQVVPAAIEQQASLVPKPNPS